MLCNWIKIWLKSWLIPITLLTQSYKLDLILLWKAIVSKMPFLSSVLNQTTLNLELKFDFNKIIKELFVNYARLINQYVFYYQTVFSARFDEKDEDNQVIDETERFINLNIYHNLTETDTDDIDKKSPLKHQIQLPEMKDIG